MFSFFSEPFVSCTPDAFLPLNTSAGLSPTAKQTPGTTTNAGHAMSPVGRCQPRVPHPGPDSHQPAFPVSPIVSFTATQTCFSLTF